jgi:type I restriction enzyme S subunit
MKKAQRGPIVKLSEVASVQSGAGFPQIFQGERNLQFPFYKVSDMNLAGNEVEMTNETNSISEETRKKLGATVFPHGSVIFPKVGGAIATNKKRLIVRPACVDNNVMGVIPETAKINSRLLFYFFHAHDLSEFANDAGLPSITKTTVENWVLGTLPPLSEQQRIVGLLDEAFASLATAQAHAAQNLQNARALFESHLNAVFTNRGNDELEKRLKEFVDDISTGPFGSLLHKSDYEVGGVPLVNPINIVDSKVVPDERKAVGEATAKRLSRYALQEDDIVIGRRGEIGRCAVISADQAGWLCGTGSFFIRPSNQMDPHFLGHLLRSPHYRKQLEQLSDRATMPSISNSDLANLVIAVPAVQRQKRIVSLLDDVVHETQRLESIYQRKLAALDELKKALLHQAFSGEL